MRDLVPERPSASWRAAWLVLPVALTTGAFAFLVRDRTDRLGHFLAGFGATLLLCWLVARAARGRPLAVGLAALVAIGLGWITEATLFALPLFDGVDFGAQSAGALLAGLALVQGRAGDPQLDPADDTFMLTRNPHGRLVAALAVVAVAAGFVLAFA